MQASAPVTHTASSRRPTHRKRFSTTRLSTETAGTLPEYNSPPPEYSGVNSSSTAVSSASESVEDCDADTEDDYYSVQTLRIPQPQQQQQQSTPFALSSPPRRRRPIYKQKSASTSRLDSALDALLERSVHALEMSNALLQQQSNTASTSSFMIDSPREEGSYSTSQLCHPGYHRTVPSKSMNIRSAPALRQRYDDLPADEFDEVTKKIDEMQLLEPPATTSESMSRSLPTNTPSMPVPHKLPSRKVSLDSERGKDGAALRLAALDRRHIVSQAPRPMTQYIESTDDLNSIVLPSTLGLRAPASTHHAAECQPPSSMVVVNKDASDGGTSSSTSTPAFALLSSLVSASNSSSPSSSYVPKSTFLTRRGSSSDRSSIVRTFGPSPSRHSSTERSRSTTPKPLVGSSSASSPVRPMTPPIEGDSPSSLSDSDNSLHPKARLTVQSLHAILDAHPPPQKPRKEFMPRTPSAQPTVVESTTTASVSRLFTKGVHTSSTRPPSPPRRSVLKRRPGDNSNSNDALSLLSPSPFASAPNSAGPSTPTPTVASSVPSSRASTPTMLFYGGGGSHKSKKRISFAALPEPHVSSTRESTAAKRKRKAGNKKKSGRGGSGKSGDEDEDGSPGWVTWLFGAAAAAGAGPSSGIGGGGGGAGVNNNGRTEERMEERIARGWGGVGRGGTFDEWGM